jgi:hypothetical protein
MLDMFSHDLTINAASIIPDVRVVSTFDTVSHYAFGCNRAPDTTTRARRWFVKLLSLVPNGIGMSLRSQALVVGAYELAAFCGTSEVTV